MTESMEESEELRTFIGEVKTMRDEEERERQTAHFLEPDFNPEELTEEDMNIWRKVQGEDITREEVRAYRESLRNAPSSRSLFGEFISNKAFAVIGRLEHPEDSE